MDWNLCGALYSSVLYQAPYIDIWSELVNLIEDWEKRMLSPFQVGLEASKSPREKTCQQLWLLLNRVWVVHARGTPASGKTCLGRALAKRINDSYATKKTMAYFGDAYKGLRYNAGSNTYSTTNIRTVEDWLRGEMIHAGVLQTHGDIYEVENLIAIIDEGHFTYEDKNFWEKFKDLGSKTTKFLLLCSWGSPTSQPVDTGRSAPPTLAPEQRLGFQPITGGQNNDRIGIFFTEDEVMDYADQFERSKQNGEDHENFHIDSNARQYVYRLTQGHGGATDGAFDLLYQVRRHSCFPPFARSPLLLHPDCPILTASISAGSAGPNTVRRMHQLQKMTLSSVLKTEVGCRRISVRMTPGR